MERWYSSRDFSESKSDSVVVSAFCWSDWVILSIRSMIWVRDKRGRFGSSANRRWTSSIVLLILNFGSADSELSGEIFSREFGVVSSKVLESG